MKERNNHNVLELHISEIELIEGGDIFDDMIGNYDPIFDAFDDFVDGVVHGWNSYEECSCGG